MESVIPPKPAKRLGMPKLSIPSRPSSSASGSQGPPPFGLNTSSTGSVSGAPASEAYHPGASAGAQLPKHSSSGSVNSLPGIKTTGSGGSVQSAGSNVSSPSHDWHVGGSSSHLPHPSDSASTYSTNATVRGVAGTGTAGVGLGYGAGFGGGYSSSKYPDTVPQLGDYVDPLSMTNDLRRAISGLNLSSGRNSVDLDGNDGAAHGGQEAGDRSTSGDAGPRQRIPSRPISDADGSDVGVSLPASGGPSSLRGQGEHSQSSTDTVTGGAGAAEGSASSVRSGYGRAHSTRSHDGSQGGHDDELVLKGNLKTLRRLGEGSSGEVQQALHEPTGLLMAKKSISTSPNPDVHRQILREVSFLRTCHSPYIVKYYGAFLEEEDTQIAICMEFCEGGSLDAIYRRVMSRNGRTGEKVLAKVAECVLKGLEYLHERNIIHRDIKPSNILVTRQGLIKLCDLGVAGELVNSVAGTFTGTSYYMAPERIQGLTNYKINSDVWSLGLSLLEVASNRFPFPPEGEPPLGPFDLITYVIAMDIPQLKDDPEIGVKWSRPMRDFIERTLEKDPGKRPGPGRMLQHPWIRRSEERQPQPDIAGFVAAVWGWPSCSKEGSKDGYGNATPSTPAAPRIA
ncbi:hypothetical protein V8E36_003523 [Tilletia maclaganii]